MISLLRLTPETTSGNVAPKVMRFCYLATVAILLLATGCGSTGAPQDRVTSMRTRSICGSYVAAGAALRDRVVVIGTDSEDVRPRPGEQLIIQLTQGCKDLEQLEDAPRGCSRRWRAYAGDGSPIALVVPSSPPETCRVTVLAGGARRSIRIIGGRTS